MSTLRNPMSPSSDLSNEENSFQNSLGFDFGASNQHISLMGDGITSFAGTITGNVTSNNGSSGVKRKREKLDHLSEEEKLMRRKLKNRISAQTARDRKKEKLSELECKVNQMSKANCLLLKENVELKKKLDLNKISELLKQNEQLQAENKQLRERLDALESKINNDYIRVTSQSTVRNISSKSNNKIKVESNSESLVAEKSKVNSIESAEEPGANQRDLSDLDQAISSLINFDGDECEEIIKWLHRCSEQLLDQNIDQLSEDSGIEDGGSHSDEASNRLSPASEEPKERDLESIRDLITFDHMYHRNDLLVQPQVDEMTVEMSPIPVETESILPENCVKNTNLFSETSLKTSISTSSSLFYPSLPQPSDNLVNKPLNFFNSIDSNILSSESAFYESNLNLFDDLFPELI